MVFLKFSYAVFPFKKLVSCFKHFIFSFVSILSLSIFLVSISFNHVQILPEQDLEISRREIAISEKIQSQLEELLGNYFKKGTYIVNVKAHIERIPIKDIKPKTTEEELELPGLPVPPSEIPSKELEKFIIDQWIFSDNFRIKYLDIIVLLDEKIFTSKDIEFVKTVIKTRAGVDEARGDSLTVKAISFPPPKELLDVKEETEIKKEKGRSSEIYPYLYLGGIILALLLFTIILLQVINLIKLKRTLPAEELFPMQRFRLPSRVPSEAAHLAGATTSEKQTLGLPPVAEHTATLQDRKDIFYELRQLMVTTLVGNPELASEIFKRWVETDKDDGIYRVAGFLKATDPHLIDLLSGYLGSDITPKVEFAMNQMLSVDREGLIETFKRFREEFQKEQSLQAMKKEEAGEVDDIFQFLKQLSTEQIFHIVKDEPPSIIAIVLAQVSSDVANIILRDLPPEKQSKVPVEMGKLKKIPVSAYRDIADKLAKKALEIEKIKYVKTDGIEALINILEQSTVEKQQEILATIAEHDILLAEELRKVYLTFDDIIRLPDKILSEVLRGVDRDTIMKALITAKSELKNKILNNLPARTKIIVSDGLKALEDSAEIPLEEIQKSRQAITLKIRELAKTGKIDLRKLFT